jgi:transmembrane sensor
MMSFPDRRTRWTAWRWFAHLRSAENSEIADRAFRHWLTRSSRNEEEFERQELIWEMLGELRGDPDIARLTKQVATQQSPGDHRTSKHWHWLRLAVASAVAASAVVAGFWTLTRPMKAQAPVVERVYATRTGEQGRITLADGSQVLLNTDTRLREVFTKHARRVILEQGEAIFTVRHDAAWPFVVVAGDTSTWDIGTAFDVMYIDKHTDVSVLQGHVQVDSTSGPPARRDVLLSARQAVRYTPDEGFGFVTAANLTRVAFWQAHQIEFDDASLLNAVGDFNRYITDKMVIADPAIDNVRVSGVFHIGDAPAFVRALHDTFGIRSEVHNGSYLLLPPAHPKSVTR